MVGIFSFFVLLLLLLPPSSSRSLLGRRRCLTQPLNSSAAKCTHCNHMIYLRLELDTQPSIKQYKLVLGPGRPARLCLFFLFLMPCVVDCVDEWKLISAGEKLLVIRVHMGFNDPMTLASLISRLPTLISCTEACVCIHLLGSPSVLCMRERESREGLQLKLQWLGPFELMTACVRVCCTLTCQGERVVLHSIVTCWDDKTCWSYNNGHFSSHSQ